jgi:hypothetical protein
MAQRAATPLFFARRNKVAVMLAILSGFRQRRGMIAPAEDFINPPRDHVGQQYGQL